VLSAPKLNLAALVRIARRLQQRVPEPNLTINGRHMYVTVYLVVIRCYCAAMPTRPPDAPGSEQK
jgi:hypothetical protein